MALQERGNGIRYDVAEVRGSLDTRLERRGLKVALFELSPPIHELA